MSESKLISPLLDGFTMGTPMSSHDGVVCCPAMKENSDQRYIVKIISIPASQRQLEALLLTGAYKDPAAAMEYFKELADGVVREAEVLQQLSQLEGFLPYEGWQVVPMGKGKLGYRVYLLSTYKQTLERQMRKTLMTHLGAVNLGLDLCAALAVCRRAGQMYVDLKPENIYVTDGREFRIGDLGFVDLAALKFTSLPSKYHSPYTAPELKDPMTTLNPTADVYSVGMILYQVYNDGQLPREPLGSAEDFPAPSNADYEMAAIIQKACVQDPKERWQDPEEMGQALVAYMQRNSVNDIPIVPPRVNITPILKAEAEPELDVPDETVPSEEDAQVPPAKLSQEFSSMLAQADDLLSHETPQMEPLPDHGAIAVEEPPAPVADAMEESHLEEDEPASKKSFLASLLPKKSAASLSMEEEDEEKEDPAVDEAAAALRKKKGRSFLITAILVLLVSLLACGGYYFYQYFYLLTINGLEVQPVESQVTILVDTDADESLLSVTYTDTYGNTKSTPVTDGKAVFTDLEPDTLYNIEVTASGFHKLTGSVSAKFTTIAQTEIISFGAVTGTEDGSVVLSFTVDGPEKSPDWQVIYSAEGEEEKSIAFSGHTVNVKELTLGKTYTFRLEPAEALYLVGENTLEFTATKIIVAEALKVVSCTNDAISVQWAAPEGIAVESWTVRCYTDGGSDETITTSETTATFSGIDTTKAYTVEVTAAGMTQPARTGVTANPITVDSVNVDTRDPQTLAVSWDYQGSAPEGGWLLMYSVDNSEAPEVVKCRTNSGVIPTRIPGAAYQLVIQAANGATVFNSSHTYSCPPSGPFDMFSLSGDRITASLCRTPSKQGWTFKDIRKQDYLSVFNAGDPISIVLQAEGRFYLNRDEITILYVFRDADGNVLSQLTSKENRSWYDMWWNTDYHYCELDLPQVPTEAGQYTLSMYFNGGAATSIEFTIVK